jgi:hypothetical protein
MPWEQLLILVVFFVFPLLQALAKKRAKEREERSVSTEPPFDFEVPDSPRDWDFPEVPPKPVFTPAVYIPPPPVAIPPLPVARREATPPLLKTRPTLSTSLPSPRTIRATLRNREGFRLAVVHKVVLGQPRALRPPN